MVRKWEAAGAALLILALIFVFVGGVLPFYKSPQRMDGSGPGVHFSSSLPYWINSYLIPPIDTEKPINLRVLSDREGATTVLLAPYDQDTQAITGAPLVNVVFAPSQKGLVIFTVSTRPGPYLLVITSYNSSYTFTVTSVWSPFYKFRTFVTYGILLLLFGMIMLYYDRIRERRERMEEDALKGIKRTGPS